MTISLGNSLRLRWNLQVLLSWVFLSTEKAYSSFPRLKYLEFILFINTLASTTRLRDGPLEKWWWGEGGGGCKKKKIHARESAKKKIHAEGRSNCDFFRKSKFQKSTILPGTIWINKNHFLLIETRQLQLCFCFKLQLVYLQHTLYTV